MGVFCGGWTLILKVNGATINSYLSGLDTTSWLLPTYFGNTTNLTNSEALGAGYATVQFDSVLIRSLNDSTKHISWKHPNTYSSLMSVISKKTRISDGTIISGDETALDYVSGCEIGIKPAGRYYGFFVDDGYYTGTTNLLNVIENGWLGALIGWGTFSNPATVGYQTAGGIGVSTYTGYSHWDLARHKWGLGNGCTQTAWNNSGNLGNQVFNGHGLFIK